MPSKSKSTKAKVSTGRSSNCRKPDSLPKTKPLSEHPYYLVVDTTLPSHIFSDRSLFTTYLPSSKLHRTVFGTNIVIEGIGDVHIRVVVSGKSILFRFRDSWHVPSSPHHFLSCSTIISLGYQIMIAGRSPRMIFSHQRRLVNPNLPKYIPFTRINHLTVLKFEIPVPSLQPASSTTQSTTETALSLPASLYHPFAGLSFNQHLLSSPNPSPQYTGIPDHLGKILPVQVLDVANGGAVNAVAGAVVVDDGVSALWGADAQLMVPVDLPVGVVEFADGGTALLVTDVDMVAHGGVARVARDVTDVVVEPDGVAVVVDHGDCVPTSVDVGHVAAVPLDTIDLDGEGHQRGTKVIIPNSSTAARVHRCADDVSYTSATTMHTKLVRPRRPMGPCSIRFVSPMPPSTLLPSESPRHIFPAKPTLSPPVNQSAFLRQPALPSLSLSISRPNTKPSLSKIRLDIVNSGSTGDLLFECYAGGPNGPALDVHPVSEVNS